MFVDTRRTMVTQREAMTLGPSSGRLDRAEPLANPARVCRGDVMRTLRLSLAVMVTLALLGMPVGTALAQGDEAAEAEVFTEVVWELPIPASALPDDFVKLVMEDWTLAPGTDTSDTRASVLGNEANRGRGLIIESGELVITPATDALLWRGSTGDAETSPAGEPVTLAVDDAIFLPAVPIDEVDDEAPIVFANPGSEAVTARSFHTHQEDGTFYGYLPGLTLGEWDMAGPFDPATIEAMAGADVLFRLSRIIGEPGAELPTIAPPGFGLYFVESGDLEQVSVGPDREFVFEWPTGRNAVLSVTEGVEKTVRVAGDEAGTLLEFAAIPQPSSSE